MIKKGEEYTATFVLRGTEIGSAKFLSSSTQYQHTFLCPHTGECWGRILIKRGIGEWIPWRHSAPEQSPFMDGEVPGSFLLPWERELILGMDEDMLKYELTCAIAQSEREN